MRIEIDDLADLGITWGSEGEMMSFLDHTATAGGRVRLLEMLRQPLGSLEQIQQRRAVIAEIESVRDAIRLRPIAADLNLAEAYARSGFLPLPRGQLSLRLLDFRYPEVTRDIVAMLRGLRRLLRWAVDQRSIWLRLSALAGIPAAKDVLHALDDPSAGALIGLPDDASDHRVGRLDSRMRESVGKITAMLHALREVDALRSLAEAGARPGFSVPVLVDGEGAHFAADGVFHPLVSEAVPNDIDLGRASRVMYITGPNTAGKTTFLRASSLVVYLAHLGARVPAASASMSVYDRLSIHLSQGDNLLRGESQFLSEVRRVKKLVHGIRAGERTFAALDEPFRGTNILDAEDAVTALVRGVAASLNGVCLVTSHLTEPPRRFRPHDAVSLGYFEANVQQQDILCDFRLRAGVSRQRLGMRLLDREGVLSALIAMCPDLVGDMCPSSADQ